MAYKRLHYNQYFIDTSEDFNNTGKARKKIEYTAVTYTNPDSKLDKFFKIIHEVNYEVHYEEERDVIQIHFQKTNGKSDWFTNIFEFSSKYYDAFDFEGKPLTLYVHHGWGDMYKTIKYDIRSLWSDLHEAHPDAETEIIGWSLGSGQAMLCCQDLNYNFGIKPYVYTFGSVKPFRAVGISEADLKHYLHSICSDCFNFANRNDVITYMPPFKGFMMISRRTVGTEKRSLLRLTDPYKYHTIYDHMELYKKKKK